VGRGGRYLAMFVGMLVFGILVRTALRSVGGAAVGLALPFVMAIPWLLFGWFNAQQRRRPRCPNCDLPLSYRRLGPSHGMLECPALCGYRRLVGSPGGPS
jgi:hypothetical protein